ncbi:hypothetical protein V8F33_013283 [Rhypophila sp. PSN 637]
MHSENLAALLHKFPLPVFYPCPTNQNPFLSPALGSGWRHGDCQGLPFKWIAGSWTSKELTPFHAHGPWYTCTTLVWLDRLASLLDVSLSSLRSTILALLAPGLASPSFLLILSSQVHRLYFLRVPATRDSVNNRFFFVVVLAHVNKPLFSPLSTLLVPLIVSLLRPIRPVLCPRFRTALPSTHSCCSAPAFLPRKRVVETGVVLEPILTRNLTRNFQAKSGTVLLTVF